MDKLLQNELFTRLLALALAILVYFQVSGGGVQRNVSGVPVQAVGVPQGLSVASITPSTVQVAVSGQAQAINTLVPSSLLGTVNLESATPGSAKYFVVVNVPQGVQIAKITPQDVTVQLDPVKTLNSPVQVTLTGVVAPGFGVGPVQASPKLVVLFGPESQIAQVVQTVATVNVQSARSTVTAQVAPEPVDKNGRFVSGVSVSPSEISVSVSVAQLPAGGQATVRPQTSGSPASGYSVTGVTASPAAVSVDGPGGTPLPIQSVDTKPLSVSGASATVSGTAAVIPPAGAASVQPASVVVTATIAPAK